MSKSGELDLYPYFVVLIKGWRKLILFGVIGFILFYAGSFLITKKYSSSVILVPVNYLSEVSPGASAGGVLSSLSGLAGLSLDSEAEKVIPVETLKSYAFLTSFISSHQIGPVLNLGGSLKHRVFKMVGLADEINIFDQYSFFSRNVMRLQEDNTRDTVTLTITWTDPELSARWAAEMVKELNKHMQQKELARLERQQTYLLEYIATVKEQKVLDATTAVLVGQLNKSMLAAGREDFSFEVVNSPIVLPEDEFTSPNRPLLGFLGLFLSLTLASFLILRASMPLAADD